MGIVDILIGYSGYFPELDLQSRELDSLKNIKPDASKGRYLALSMCMAIALAAVVFVLSGQQADLLGAGVFLGIVAASLAAFIKLPAFEMSVKAGRMESELPIVLRTIALLLEMNVPFPRALGVVGGADGELNRELGAVANECERGASLQKTLSALSGRTKSLLIKRAVNQLLTVYQTGTGAAELKRLADELLSIQRFRLREYASKAALLGLLFIAFSTILPTFFIVTTVIGKGIIESDISKDQVILVFLAVFPALSALIVLIARAMLPEMVLGNRPGFNSVPAIAVLVLLASTLMLPESVSPFVIAATFLILAFALVQDYRAEKRIYEIEEHMPDALMSASALPRGAKIDRLYGVWADARYGPLSDESRICARQLSANIKPENVVSDMASRNKSRMLKRVGEFIITAINTNTMDRLNQVAEDILRFREVDRERQNALAMQRHTLVFASFLMPLITKSSIALVSSMQKFGTVVDFSVFYGIMPAYILIYALLTAYFIAELEARRHSATMYFMISAAIALVTFYFISI